MFVDKYQHLIDTLGSLGFNVIENDFPLKVSLEQLTYPVAILTNDSASGNSRTGFVEIRVSVSLLWPGSSHKNYLACINQGQAIASSLGTQDYVVTPISHKTPDVSGGLVRLTVKTTVSQICKPVLEDPYSTGA